MGSEQTLESRLSNTTEGKAIGRILITKVSGLSQTITLTGTQKQSSEKNLGLETDVRFSLLSAGVHETVSSPSVEPILRSRMLPPVSFRALFALTTVGAVAFAIARAAGRGAAFAVAMEFAFGFLLLCFGLFGLLSLIAWVVAALVVRDTDRPDQGSPFAEDRLPPQLLPPREQPS